eukprot:CAMPEP_0168748890 /NCGR_PEP_ID=MMETSP0724-20121128/16415_1 /TAXON_ID=265536 /ORGANISM="Amphiprora sp., Strain CCMP467" /LENGTH=377 /DNA_ID=CAMNT_0008796745 /DNA_START=94 /DNA_END=1227 /DNA_ORIENTATION=+
MKKGGSQVDELEKTTAEANPAATQGKKTKKRKPTTEITPEEEVPKKAKVECSEDVARAESPTQVTMTEESESKKSQSTDSFIDIEKAQYTFPERLMELLMNESVEKAMWWLPGGEAFALVPNTFYDTVLAKYFQGTKLESFTRKLNRWGFKRLSGQGIPKGTIAYYHKLFKKDQSDLMKKMRSGKGSQNQESSAVTAMFGKTPAAMSLESPMLPATVDPAAQFLAAQLRSADATSLLLAQQAGLLPSATAPTPSAETTLLQLLAVQQARQEAAAAQQLRAAQQQQQDLHRVQALAQLSAGVGGVGGSLDSLTTRHAELLALEELRVAQEAAAAQVELRARLLQGSTTAPQPPAPGLSSEDQIRLALLQRQLAGRGAW